MVQVLTGLRQALNMAFIEEVILQAECFSDNFVKNWQDPVWVGDALFHEFNARI